MTARPEALAGWGLLLALALGCSTPQGEIPVVAVHGGAATLAALTDSSVPVKRGVAGSDWAITSVLFVPTGARPRLKQAMDRARDRAGGGSVISARVWTTNFWALMSVSRLSVIADVAQITQVGGEPAPGHFAALGPRRVPVDLDEDTIVRRVSGVEASDTVRHFLWVPTSPQPPTLEAALIEAIGVGDGDILVDAEIEYTWWTVPFLYSVERWRARGDAVRLPRESQLR